MSNRYKFLPIFLEILLDTNSNNAVYCHTQLFSLKIVADRKHFVSGFSEPPASSRFFNCPYRRTK